MQKTRFKPKKVGSSHTDYLDINPKNYELNKQRH